MTGIQCTRTLPAPPTASVGRSPARFRALDGLRGAAALLVAFYHIAWPHHFSGANFLKNGYLAVDLFFILSGLVIASNYSNRIRNVRDTTAFICLRFFRLYPLHIAVLCFFFVLEVAKLIVESTFGIVPENPPFTGGESYGALAANILLIHGLHVTSMPTWNGPSWTISCEFAAYLLFGAVTVVGLTRTKAFNVVAFIVAVATYIVMALDRQTLDIAYDWGILRCIAGFTLGMLVCRVLGEKMLKQFRRYLGVVEIVIVICMLLAMGLASGWAVVLVIPFFVSVIALLQSDRGPVAKFMITRPIQFLGRISYSIYMVHSVLIVILFILLKRMLPSSIDPLSGERIIHMNLWLGDLLAVCVLAAVLALAATTFAYVEEPARLFGRRLMAAWSQ